MSVNSIASSFFSELFKQSSENNNKVTEKQDNTVHFSKPLFLDRTMSGSYEGMDYEIKHPESGLFDKSENYNGKINNQKAEYEITPKLFGGDSIEGTIGKKEVDLDAKKDWKGETTTITGTYDGKDVELTIKDGLFGLTVKGKNTNVTISDKALFSDDKVPSGSFGYDNELFPIIETYIVQNIDNKDKNIFISD